MWSATSFLQFYLNFFGDRRQQFIDLLPAQDPNSTVAHVPLDERLIGPVTQKDIEEMDQYKHTCWCNPELIYADDVRGNEVWLHKHIQ